MSVLDPAWGTLDGTHAEAIRAAHQFYGEHGWAQLRGLGASRAVSAGQWADRTPPAEHVGVFLLAFMSTAGALDVERTDRQETFSIVADEWWGDPAHQGIGVTPYGPPWGAR